MSGIAAQTLQDQERERQRIEDRRREQRHKTIMRVGLLHGAGYKELCLVRNISAGGMMARVYRAMAVGETLSVELREGQLLSGTVAWSRDWYVGISFDAEIDVEDALATRWVSEFGHRPRLPRIDIDCPARIRVGSRFYAARLRNISQGGAKVQLFKPLAAWGDAALSLLDLPPLKSQIRWMFDDFVGLSFNERLPFEVLALWLQDHRAIEEARAAEA